MLMDFLSIALCAYKSMSKVLVGMPKRANTLQSSDNAIHLLLVVPVLPSCLFGHNCDV